MKWQDLPPHKLYPRLIPHVLKLCIKYRAPISIITKSNPAFPYGGLPFAPKDKMSEPFSGILPYVVVKKSWTSTKKLNVAKKFAKKFPLIAKPNAGHRGIDVRLISDKKELETLVSSQKWDYMLQEFCDFDYEFGVFYCRMPDEDKGKIISLTKKIIPVLVGNGKDSIRKLVNKSKIENKSVLLERHADKLDMILPKGKKFKTLVMAAHSRGAMFYDAMDLVTNKLVKKINKVCDVPGFYFGRLDVKAKSIEEFKKGNFKIIEVNGATSEFIHVYDNKFTLKQGIADL